MTTDYYYYYYYYNAAEEKEEVVSNWEWLLSYRTSRWQRKYFYHWAVGLGRFSFLYFVHLHRRHVSWCPCWSIVSSSFSLLAIKNTTRFQPRPILSFQIAIGPVHWLTCWRNHLLEHLVWYRKQSCATMATITYWKSKRDTWFDS